MNKPEYIKKLGGLNPVPYLDFIRNNPVIFLRDERKKRDIVFGDAKVFFLLEEFRSNTPDITKQFEYVAKDLFKFLGLCYGPGTIYNIQFALLPPGEKIKGHYDQGLQFSLSQRIHVPLVTCRDVVFHIDNRKFNFEAGLIVEINNNEYHAVENNSQNTERVHLIIDYVPKKYVKYIYSP